MFAHLTEWISSYWGDLEATYEVHDELGSGGMAIVHAAVNRLTGEEVAIKVMREECVERENLRERFNGEIDILERCRSPYVLRLIGDGTLYGLPAYAAERCKESLYHIGCPGPLPVERTLKYMAEVLAGLDQVHALGFVHRDLKPSNILIGRDGRVRVADFGVALNPKSRVTLPGAMVGSPSYAAPEPERNTPMHDLYSVGATTFALLTHSRIYTIRNPDTAPTYLSKLPPLVGAMIGRAMHADPAKRYHSAGEMAVDLQAALKGG